MNKGYWFKQGETVYLVLGVILVILYCLGWIIFWKRVGRIPEKQRDELDNLLINLGGMALTGNWRWSRSKGNGSLQNGWCYACNVSNTYSWSCHYYVRPVLGL